MNKRIGPLLLLWFVALSALAEEDPPVYQVEVLVFKTGALKGWTEEFWPWPDSLKRSLSPPSEQLSEESTAFDVFDETYLMPEKAASVLTSSENPPQQPIDERDGSNDLPPPPQHADPLYLDDILSALWPDQAPPWVQTIRPVEAQNYLLQEALQKLTPQKGYTIIYHRAWRQPAYGDHQAVALSVDEITPKGEQLTGTIKFYKNRYAHMEVDLTLWRKIPTPIRARFAQHENLPLTHLPETWPFHLQASRKMKSGEWHYLDHPLFGVLMVIQRIQQ